MIDALITGRIVHCKAEENMLVGRIVMEGDKPVQFTAKRGIVKAALLALPSGMPLCVAGPMSSRIKHDKDGQPYVCNEVLITAVLTALPQTKGLFGSIL